MMHTRERSRGVDGHARMGSPRKLSIDRGRHRADVLERARAGIADARRIVLDHRRRRASDAVVGVDDATSTSDDRDMVEFIEFTNDLSRASDRAMLRVTLGVIDGLKRALRQRDGGASWHREASVAMLFALSTLATHARDDVLRDESHGDALLDVYRVQCKTIGMEFGARVRAMREYARAVREDETGGKDVVTVAATTNSDVGSVNTAATMTTNTVVPHLVVGGLAQMLADDDGRSVRTPDLSDEDDEEMHSESGGREKRRSISSLCASPSRIFYSPHILSGKNASSFEEEPARIPPGVVICRLCEQPIAKVDMPTHNEMCIGQRSRRTSFDSHARSSHGDESLASAEDVANDQVTIDDFKIIKLISGGAHGRVFLAQKYATGDFFAVKAIRKRDLVYKNMMDQVVAERDALIAAANPFTIKLFYSFTSARHAYLVTEYANGGDLYSLLSQLGRLSEEHARRYCAEITLALEYVHSKGVTHRDLKPGNCLIASDGHIKLADFGLSRIDRDAEGFDPTVDSGSDSPSSYGGSFGGVGSLSSPASPSSGASMRFAMIDNASNMNSPIHRMMAASDVRRSPSASPSRKLHRRSMSASRPGSGAKGTPDYLAPEVLLCEPCGEAVDWWALGVMAYEMLIGAPPFNAPTPLAIFSNIIGCDVQWPVNSDELSDESKNFVNALLTHDVDARLGSAGGAEDVKAHPWFANIEWETVYDKSAESVFVPKPDSKVDTSYFVPSSPLGRSKNVVGDADAPPDEDADEDNSSFSDDGLELTRQMSMKTEETDDSFSEFTYKNLAELAMRNMKLSGASSAVPRAPQASSSGLPRRGSIGKELNTHADE